MNRELRLRLNLDAVAAFAVFADHLNVSAAARQLHISQPALHVKIRKLAEQVGRPLYVRAGSALALTEAGRQVARFGREILDQTSDFAARLAPGYPGEELRLAAGDGAYLYLVGGAIRRFLASADCRLRLTSRDRDGALDDVLSGRADLGVAPLESSHPELELRTLTNVGQMLVVPAGHRLAAKRRLRLGDLRDCELVVPPEDRPHRRLLARLLQSADVPWSVAVEAQGWELMIRFVQIGVGLAVVNACCRLPRGLKGIPIPELPSLRYHLFHRKGAQRRPPVRRLCDELLLHGNDWMTNSPAGVAGGRG
jgi:DNA-binding transcriptional LysR family regulator